MKRIVLLALTVSIVSILISKQISANLDTQFARSEADLQQSREDRYNFYSVGIGACMMLDGESAFQHCVQFVDGRISDIH